MKTIRELTIKHLKDFDTLSANDKSKALAHLVLEAHPTDGHATMCFLDVMMSILLPMASTQVHHRETKEGLSFKETILMNGHGLLKDALLSMHHLKSYEQYKAVFDLMTVMSNTKPH